MNRLFLIACFITLGILAVSGQQLTLPLSQTFFPEVEEGLYAPGSTLHTAIRPWLESEVQDVVNLDSLQGLNNFSERGQHKFPNWLFRKAFNEHFAVVDKPDFLLQVDPVFNIEVGKDVSSAQDLRFMNTRGIQAQGNITKKFSYFTTFYENQGSFVPYLQRRIRGSGVIPGQGLLRSFGEDGYDYAWSGGNISYTPTRYLNVQLGHGKQFIGDGYRSLLLSDNSFNYPYLRIAAKVWRLKYIITYAQFMDLQLPHGANIGYCKKYGTFHYLSYDISKRLQIGLFEAIIWRASDSTGYRGFDVNYLNPVIFFRPVEFSQGSPDNALMGANASMKIRKHTVLYGQLLLDEFKVHEIFSGKGWWGNKLAFQLGFRTFELAGVRNLYLQSEFNFVRPYTYSSRSSDLNYGHYNQALAHPLGANFMESVTILRYHYARFFTEVKFNYAFAGNDSTGTNYGSDIFQPYTTRPNEYGNYTGQGIPTNIYIFDGRVSYLVNPATQLNISLGITDRYLDNAFGTDHSTYVYLGLRTSLHNFYYDY